MALAHHEEGPVSLSIDRTSQQPLYRQIADELQRWIQDGRLRPGERLPTVRHLAEDLDVTRPTVHRAFQELKRWGCIEATVGRGTFVRSDSPDNPAPPLRRRLTPDRVLDDIQSIGDNTEVRVLAHAEPAAELLPGEAFLEGLRLTGAEAAELLRYASPQGDPLLREQLALRAAARGIETTADDILVTTGVTQGMSLLAAALARPGDRVAVEQPTYLGLLHILEARGIVPVGVPLDDEGPRLDHLERVIAQDRPRFFYTVPVFQNPTGISMSERRRSGLLTLARRHGLTIVEDDIYHPLALDGPPPPSLKQFDTDGRVIYLDGFSKVGLPGARIGHLIASPTLLERLISLRRADDLCGPLPLQRAMASFLARGEMKKHLARALPVYRRRRDALLGALEEHMPAGVSWTDPRGGFSVWVRLPTTEGFDDLYAAALERGVLFTPGEVFVTGPTAAGRMRLCFGNQPEKVLREGVEILAGLIRERLERGPRPRRQADRGLLV